jgi:hypothetical protein
MIIRAIEEYIDIHHQNSKPFIWAAKVNDMMDKVTCAQMALNQLQSA